MIGKIFETQKEIFQHLLNKGKVRMAVEGNKSIFYLGEDGILLKENYENNVTIAGPISFSFPDDWMIYEEPKWHESIPDQGVLCWVSDFPITCTNNSSISIIKRRDSTGYFVSDKGYHWKFAKPMTKSEIDNLIYKE
jgi:hypothetical protein